MLRSTINVISSYLQSLVIIPPALTADTDDNPVSQRYRIALKEGDAAILRCIEDERLPLVSITDIVFLRERQKQGHSIDPVCFSDVSQQAIRAESMKKFCDGKPGCILKASDPAQKPSCRSAYLLIRYTCEPG